MSFFSFTCGDFTSKQYTGEWYDLCASLFVSEGNVHKLTVTCLAFYPLSLFETLMLSALAWPHTINQEYGHVVHYGAFLKDICAADFVLVRVGVYQILWM